MTNTHMNTRNKNKHTKEIQVEKSSRNVLTVSNTELYTDIHNSAKQTMQEQCMDVAKDLIKK